ncbi:MAG: hypothetical protein HUJ68_03655 [Clostridia bacterium]|nr:hypothetical protein [Clostridia bacterium]
MEKIIVRSGKVASWVKVLRSLNAANSPMSAAEILEKSDMKFYGTIKSLHNEGLICRKAVNPRGKMGYTLSYNGLKKLNEAEKEIKKMSRKTK